MPFAAGKSTTVVDGLTAPPTGLFAPRQKPPTLYEFEACPYCRFVREAVTALDLVVDIKPCGRGSRHRAEARELGGKEQFPLLVDGDTIMYESMDIVNYLAEKRGTTLETPKGGVAASAAATAFRAGRGGSVSEGALSKPPRKLLELYSYEGNQFCRLVREVLCELDLPYRLYSAGKGSPRRDELAQLAGSSQCPYLVDPNTNTAIAESADIVAYLAATYGEFDKK
jgi:anaphase-promoting complex subunit 7